MKKFTDNAHKVFMFIAFAMILYIYCGCQTTEGNYDHYRSKTMKWDKHYYDGCLVYTSKKHLYGREMYRDTFVNDSVLFKLMTRKK